ncbi:hypothetical protein EYF80_020141 [Liparis tanakae]|uniref:Uncharacterized protein n=1 Tax=Liparis tanakae TaxID=230148 RepID=A0A4Z2HVN5_9TELE|nr:hypothetical protein EYF80_020141 [Liparis tanakae]
MGDGLKLYGSFTPSPLFLCEDNEQTAPCDFVAVRRFASLDLSPCPGAPKDSDVPCVAAPVVPL